jgi:small conductance mechanosensitive channel
MDPQKAYELISDKLTIWVKELIRLLPNLALAILAILLGFLVAKAIRKLMTRIFQKFINQLTIINLFSSFVYLMVIGISLFVALSILHLDGAVTSILAGAGILGLALAFAFQDIAANFMSGIFLSFRKPFKPGDIVKTNDIMGRIVMINLRDTIIKTFQGQTVIIPNKEIFQSNIENFSTVGKRRLDLAVGISYGDDLEKVKKVTLHAVKDISVLEDDEPIRFFYESFGDSSINFIVQLWFNSPDQPIYLQGRSEAIMKIKKAFDENDISIPYPIRTLDFGIKGGEKLSEMVLQLGDRNHLSSTE